MSKWQPFALQLPVFGCNMLHADEECVIKEQIPETEMCEIKEEQQCWGNEHRLSVEKGRNLEYIHTIYIYSQVRHTLYIYLYYNTSYCIYTLYSFNLHPEESLEMIFND